MRPGVRALGERHGSSGPPSVPVPPVQGSCCRPRRVPDRRWLEAMPLLLGSERARHGSRVPEQNSNVVSRTAVQLTDATRVHSPLPRVFRMHVHM